MKRFILMIIVAVAAAAGLYAAGKGDTVATLDDASYSAVVKNVKRPVVIDFSATWCGPCKIYGPTFHAVAKEYAGKADFYTVDIDKAPEMAAAFGVQAVPTTVVLYGSDGKGYAQPGLISADILKKMIDTAIGNMK